MANGVVSKTTRTREKYWQHWCDYARACRIDPFLKHVTNLERDTIIGGYAARVRRGYYGKGATIKVQAVTDALSSISKTIELVGEQSPLYKDPSGSHYTTPIQRIIEGFRRDDPPPVPQLAVPVAVPNLCYEAGMKNGSSKATTIGNLALIAFYYLLRVGEYTKPKFSYHNGVKRPATRTKQFRVGDVGFFKNGKILPRSSPLEVLLECDAATLKITNQKNGQMGQTIHQEAISDMDHCPVRALARQVHAIFAAGGTTQSLLCTYFTEAGEEQAVTSQDMIMAVRSATKLLNLEGVGICPDLVGSHSLRAGGAMAMKLHGESDTTIMKFGRWRSATFLMYIHNQIAHLSEGVSQRMSQEVPFTNIAAIEDS